ncbi:MAG: tetratricopeptide repeat protein [Planctomycetota bacterium]
MVDYSKHLQKAEESLRRRNYDFAVELYRQLIDLDPDLGDARRGLRQALKKRHETKSGGRLLRAVSGALPFSKAKTMHKLGKHGAAAKALEDYLATNPLDEDANLLLGICLEEQQHYHSARAVYEFVAEIAPKNPDGLKRAGSMLQRTGDPHGALEYYERALSADPRDQEALKARKNLAAETALSGSRSDTVAHSRELIKDKAEARTLERAQRRHLSDEELREELEQLEARFADDGSNPDLMLEMASHLEKLKDPEAALDLVRRAQSYRRDSYDIVMRLGLLEAKVQKRKIAQADKAGDTERAGALERELFELEAEDYRRQVAMRPSDAALRLQLGKRLLKIGATDEALAELQRCQGEARVSDEAVFLLGRCFQEKGILDLAIKQYEKALEGRSKIDERAKEILYHLGTLAETKGDTEAARSNYIRIYEVDIAYKDVALKMQSL